MKNKIIISLTFFVFSFLVINSVNATIGVTSFYYDKNPSDDDVRGYVCFKGKEKSFFSTTNHLFKSDRDYRLFVCYGVFIPAF